MGWVSSFLKGAQSCFCSTGLGEAFAPQIPAQHVCTVLAELKERGQFGFVQGNTYSSCFEIDIQGRLSSRQLQPSSPSLLPDKLRHFPVSGECFEQYKQQSPQNLLVFPFLQLLFFIWTFLLSHINLPCLSSHGATWDKEYYPSDMGVMVSGSQRLHLSQESKVAQHLFPAEPHQKSPTRIPPDITQCWGSFFEVRSHASLPSIRTIPRSPPHTSHSTGRKGGTYSTSERQGQLWRMATTSLACWGDRLRSCKLWTGRVNNETVGPRHFWCLSPREHTQRYSGRFYSLLYHTALGILLSLWLQKEHRGMHLQSAVQAQHFVSEPPATAIHEKGMDVMVPAVQSSTGKTRS